MSESKWGRKIHVQSSLDSKDEQFAMFVGRWQPLHMGHKELFQQALNDGKNVLICIRDVQPDEKNPFTSDEVRSNIMREYYKEIGVGKIKVMIIPDISSIEFGRGVGYDIIEHIPPTEIGDISATKIRENMRKDGLLF
jgi:cytidyltransferase-like protein